MTIQKQNISFILESKSLMNFSLDVRLNDEFAGNASFSLNLNEQPWNHGLCESSFEEATKTWLFDLAIAEGFQGKGLARALLNQLENVVAKLNAELGIDAPLKGTAEAQGSGLTQEALVAFYERYGFSVENDDVGIIIEKSCQSDGSLFDDNFDFQTEEFLERVSS